MTQYLVRVSTCGVPDVQEVMMDFATLKGEMKRHQEMAVKALLESGNAHSYSAEKLARSMYFADTLEEGRITLIGAFHDSLHNIYGSYFSLDKETFYSALSSEFCEFIS